MEKHFSEYGSELTAAAAALVNFEKDKRKEIAALTDEHDALQRKIEAHEAKLAREQADLAGRLSNFHRELSEREARARQDGRAELGRKTLTAKGRKLDASEDALEAEILETLQKPARGILALRGRALDILKLERELAGLRLEASQVAEKPFRWRQQAALDFFRSLLAVAQIDVRFIQGGANFGETKRWADEVKRLDEALAIAKGSLTKHAPLHFVAVSADQVLQFALELPETAFDQVFRAWQAVKISGGKSASLTFKQTGTLTWRFRRSRIVDAPRISQIADYEKGAARA